MFKENTIHETPELFSEKNMMPENLIKRYENSWAKGFYEDVFCKIDETIFEVLYSKKTSRPNTPVNIYVSLEILKELFGLSDEQLLDRFHFDNLFIFALGLNRIGDKTISERAFYYMRHRVVDHEDKTGINLFEKVFTNLKDDYIKKFAINQDVKRIDSTLIGSNIRRLNRLKLFLEVLNHFLKKLDENSMKKLSKEIKEYKDVNTENYVYSLTSDESKMKIKEIAEYLYRIKVLFEKDSIRETKSYKILERLVSEQLQVTDEKKKIELKDPKDLSSSCLQSPYDPDATYRKKGNQARQGYSVTAAETCNPENDLQIITNIIVEENNIDDSKILEENFETILEDKTDELIGDGAYSNKNVQKKLADSKKNIITTAIRGRKPDSDQPSSTDFKIENNKIIECPYGMKPIEQNFTDNKITAKFSQTSCVNCTMNCFIRRNKQKPHVLIITKERLLADMQRLKYKDKDYLRKCKLRPAVEGTMFQMKLHLRNGKSKYRGKIKVKCSSILRSIAINYKRVYAYKLKEALFDFIFENIDCLRVILKFKNTVSSCNA